jgi:hypothetical protein
MEYASIEDAWRPAFEHPRLDDRFKTTPRTVTDLRLTSESDESRAYNSQRFRECTTENDVRRAIALLDRIYRKYGLDAALNLLPSGMVEDVRDRWEGRGRSPTSYIDADPRYFGPVARGRRPEEYEPFTDAPSTWAPHKRSKKVPLLTAVLYSATAGLLALVILDVIVKTFMRNR